MGSRRLLADGPAALLTTFVGNPAVKAAFAKLVADINRDIYGIDDVVRTVTEDDSDEGQLRS